MHREGVASRFTGLWWTCWASRLSQSLQSGARRHTVVSWAQPLFWVSFAVSHWNYLVTLSVSVFSFPPYLSIAFSCNLHRVTSRVCADFLVAKASTGSSNEAARALAAAETESPGSSGDTAPRLATISNPRAQSSTSTPSSSCTRPAAPVVPSPSVAVADEYNIGLNTEAPSQPIALVFPKRNFGKSSRSLCPGWYRGRPWLEYSAKLDACFCFPCQKFGGNNDRDLVFTKQGFTNWKTALEKDKGLSKHASSQCHIKNAKACSEMSQREATGETICNLIGPTQMEKNRYYIKTIGEVVQFLAVNELPLRGSVESSNDDDFSAGKLLKHWPKWY